MAEIVLGVWTTHGPTLSTTPEQWLLRLPADRARRDHPFRGKTYDFPSLVELRKDEHLGSKVTLEERTHRAQDCRNAINRVAEIFDEARIDVAVIFGNDQHEVFLDDLIPSLTVFNGPTIWNAPSSEEQAAMAPPGIHVSEWGHKPPHYTEYPGHPELANLILRQAVADGFDVARSSKLPKHPGNWHSGIGHAFGFIYRQIMRDKPVANVPLFANTFFPPNQPSAARCFAFGQSVGRAIRALNADLRVAVFGSGGMSHFVIDENFDRMVIAALQARDAQRLCSIGEEYLQSGTSELKNWVAAAGCLFDTDLAGGLVDYVPCYRSEAGTGTANGWVAWNRRGLS
jgi:OH-DDVA oxygenase/3-O-methylgallate 3,4-dioxygenase